MDVKTLSAAERALWDAFPRGEIVDLTGRPRVAARTIRAEVIAALLLGALPAEAGRIAAVRLIGTRIVGTLDLAHGVVTVPVRLQRCQLQDVIDLTGTKARDIDLSGSNLAGLTAPLAEVDGKLDLSGCECSGAVVLSGAHITGALELHDTRLTRPGAEAFLGNRLTIDDDLVAVRASVDGEFLLAGSRIGGSVLFAGASLRNEGGYALYAPDMTAGARFLMRDGFEAHGEVRLVGLRVGGDLNFRNAFLCNPGGDALLAYGIQIGGSLGLSEGFRSQGAVRLSRSRIGGAIFLEHAHLENPAGDVIRCRNTQAQTLHLGPGLETTGIADFRNSQFANIRDEGASWPQRLRLSGLSYGELAPPLSAAVRVGWLRRDADGYHPRNYETLAAMYRNSGDDAAARRVLLARERERRAHLPWYGKAWSWLQEVTVGYGYRPLRAAAWLLAFLAAGTVAFGLHHPPPLAGVPHPAFNPFIYALDLLIPLVDLGQRSAYDPQGPQRWLAYLLIAVGWIFVTTIAAGIARVLRRQ
ncbi:MAG TPA: hypothetical protein VIL16_11220 [Trebonia sp.]